MKCATRETRDYRWAQVNGLRGETQTLDLMYRRHRARSLVRQKLQHASRLRILARTVLEVVRPRNAY